MKKLKVIIIMALALLFFTGCKKENQKEFSAELAKQNEMNAGNYSVVVDELAIKGNDQDAPTRASMEMIAKMVSGTKITGDYQKDTEAKLAKINMNIAALGQTVPLNLYFDMKENDPSVYLSTEFMSKALEIAKEFNAETPIDAKEFEQFKGKYIHLTNEDLEKNTAGKKQTSDIAASFNSKHFADYLATLDTDSFKQEGDTIQRTFTKKDLQGFFDYVKENGSKKEQASIKDAEKRLDQLSSYKQTTTLNTQKHSQTTTMQADAKNTEATLSLKLTIKNDTKDSKQKIELPKKGDTISVEEFTEKMSAGQQQGQVSQEEFADILADINSSNGQITPESAEQVKRAYKPYLTEEQYEQLEEALNSKTTMAT
ncbi:hypothetical protein [Enterococcus devriesei]|uniref:hypothetical protein n=1 Tax=Enterococcus devriesei TaxID=319970 RepID=UPI0028AF215F|nr:hypothetical protein [Enterococcus devriesei]